MGKVQVAQIIDTSPGSIQSSRQFILIETYETSEGLRTRICGERFGTLERAQAACVLRNRVLGKANG